MGKFVQIMDSSRLIIQREDGHWSYVRLAALGDDGSVWGYTAEETTKHTRDVHTLYPSGWSRLPDARNPQPKCKHG